MVQRLTNLQAPCFLRQAAFTFLKATMETPQRCVKTVNKKLIS